jgi:long-chain acyl-CoA synthetase
MYNQLDHTTNLLDLFEQSTDLFKNNKFLGYKSKTTGEFEWSTYGDIRKRTDNFRGGMAGISIKAGDTVGIIANNRPEWPIAAFATYGLKARFVPMYRSEILKVWRYIIEDSEIKFLLVATKEIFEQIKSIQSEIPTLKHIYCIECEGEFSMAALEQAGAEKPVASQAPAPSDIAALIYTSGTTNDPKGVLLTHSNFRSNALGGYHLYPVLTDKSVSLSILPWAHSYGQTAELYNWFQFGGAIGIMESAETLADDLLKVQPTFLLSVPRVFNKIYDGIFAKMKETGGVKEKLFNMTVSAAKKRRENKSDFMNNLKFKLGDKLVFSKIREKLGGKLEGSLTASALMNPEVAAFFGDVGLPIYDCYGLSETSPAVTMNAPGANRPGSVGKPIERVEIKIDFSKVDDKEKGGEILVKGPNLMVGYNKKPEATNEILTVDGWLRTGDRGRIDNDGYLWITGRIKEQYKLENGKYVYPAALEEDIRLLPYVENAMVYGESKAFNVCVVVPDCAVLKKTAETLKLQTSVGKLIHSPIVQDFISNEIQKSLKSNYGSYEIPKKFIFAEEGFSIENGMLTPTLKLKRRKVIEKYQEQIDKLYKNT